MTNEIKESEYKENKEKKEAKKLPFSDYIQFKGAVGLVKIALIFVGVLVCLVVAIPLAPFVLRYFIKDRKLTHIERMKAPVTVKKRVESVNAWSNGS